MEEQFKKWEAELKEKGEVFVSYKQVPNGEYVDFLKYLIDKSIKTWEALMPNGIKFYLK